MGSMITVASVVGLSPIGIQYIFISMVSLCAAVFPRKRPPRFLNESRMSMTKSGLTCVYWLWSDWLWRLTLVISFVSKSFLTKTRLTSYLL